MSSILAQGFPSASSATRPPEYQELKARVHRELLNRLNLDRLTRMKRQDAEPELRSLIIDMAKSKP